MPVCFRPGVHVFPIMPSYMGVEHKAALLRGESVRANSCAAKEIKLKFLVNLLTQVVSVVACLLLELRNFIFCVLASHGAHACKCSACTSIYDVVLTSWCPCVLPRRAFKWSVFSFSFASLCVYDFSFLECRGWHYKRCLSSFKFVVFV